MEKILFIHYWVDNYDDIDSIVSFIWPWHTYETIDELIEDNWPLERKWDWYFSESWDQFKFFSAKELHLQNEEVVIKTILI
jgi:hypothetical protein